MHVSLCVQPELRDDDVYEGHSDLKAYIAHIQA
jgi:hypothetical protein